MRLTTFIALGIACSVGAVAAVAAVQAPTVPKSAPSPEAAEFFETQVRPVLAQRCFACHGPQVQQAGFRLDSLQAALKGTSAGHAGIVPGDPDRSLLVQVVRYNGDVKMPPGGKLPQKEIDALTAWVKMGAPWPAGASQAGASTESKHWAFVPVRQPKVPAVHHRAWVKTSVDAFILARLEKKGMVPSPPASR